MKHLKMLGLLAVAAAALFAVAGTASATILTSGGTTYTGNIVATSTNYELDGAFVTVKCGHSKAEGAVKTHGAGTNVSVPLTSLTFTECNYATTVKNAGTLEINSSNGVFSTGTEVSINTSVGTCVFTTNNTSVGTLQEGASAIWIPQSAKIPRTGGNWLCGGTGTMTGSYTIMAPSSLYVD